MPPDFLLEKAEPLAKPPVETNEQLVRRTLTAESEYENLRQRFNILIDWITPPET